MRPAAAAVAALAWGSLALLIASQVPDHGPVGAFWLASAFYTNLTTLAVAVLAARAALGRPDPVWLAGFTLHAVMVGALYHALLAHLWHPTGLLRLADIGQHTLLPVALALFWALCVPKAVLRPRHALLWLAWPVAYLGWMLARGAVTGFHPYWFLDPATLGPAAMLRNIALLAALFWLAGRALVVAARRLAPR